MHIFNEYGHLDEFGHMHTPMIPSHNHSTKALKIYITFKKISLCSFFQ